MSATKEAGATLVIEKWVAAILGTVLGGLLLSSAVGFWHYSAVLVELGSNLQSGKEARLKAEAQNNDAHARIEQKLDRVATIREVEELKARVVAIEIEFRRLDVEIIKLKGGKP